MVFSEEGIYENPVGSRSIGIATMNKYGRPSSFLFENATSVSPEKRDDLKERVRIASIPPIQLYSSSFLPDF